MNFKFFLGLLILFLVFAKTSSAYGQTSTIDTITAPSIPTSTLTSPPPTTNQSPSGPSSSIVQPSPQIIHPQNNSRLAGKIVVEIFINATVVLAMNVYASSSSSKNIFLGGASQTQGTYYQFWWETKNVANNDYSIYAEAKLANGVKTYSDKIRVSVANEAVNSTTPPTENTTENTTGTAENSEGLETQTQNGSQTSLTTKTPETSVPVATPPPAANPTVAENALENSRVLTTLNFQLDADKPLHMEKIEGRLSPQNNQFLVFAGKSYPNSNPIITINSQPLVLSAAADSSGNWTYTLENPLEPGKHEVFVEVNTTDQGTSKSGPYPFTIAQAQATAANPTGASLELVDPQKQALNTYLYAAGGLIGLAILGLAIFFYFQYTRKKALQYSTNQSPTKEI